MICQKYVLFSLTRILSYILSEGVLEENGTIGGTLITRLIGYNSEIFSKMNELNTQLEQTENPVQEVTPEKLPQTSSCKDDVLPVSSLQNFVVSSIAISNVLPRYHVQFQSHKIQRE